MSNHKKEKKRELLFRLTKKDFRFDVFRAGGKGGQGQNKRSTGVRCVHIASGAVGEGRDARSQSQNKQNAFKRCVYSDHFQLWLRKKINREAERAAEIERYVEKAMEPGNIVVQTKDDKGNWVDVDPQELS